MDEIFPVTEKELEHMRSYDAVTAERERLLNDADRIARGNCSAEVRLAFDLFVRKHRQEVSDAD